jgi:hypothetical protein
MIKIRKGKDRGYFDHGWLKTYHTFSFGEYDDPDHHSFRQLRVMNEDWVDMGKGFGTHPHRDMEIVTYVLQGALEHKDSMGNGEVLRPGEFQRMTAGTGITHSEFNPSPTEPVHLYQIWLFPNKKGLTPSYEQKKFPPEELRNRLRLVASPDAEDGSLTIHQDARIYLSQINSLHPIVYPVGATRHVWVQVLLGHIELQGHKLEAGDGVAISDETEIKITTTHEAEIMLFDLA